MANDGLKIVRKFSKKGLFRKAVFTESDGAFASLAGFRRDFNTVDEHEIFYDDFSIFSLYFACFSFCHPREGEELCFERLRLEAWIIRLRG